MLHRHGPFELYRVRSGELAIYLEGDDGAVTRSVVGPGAVVPIGAGVEHTVRNETDEDAEALSSSLRASRWSGSPVPPAV